MWDCSTQGVTFRVERGELVIARILHGGMVAQQGLLHIGDVIREVNGQEVGSDPRVLQDSLRHASGSVVLKILPSYQEPHPPRQVLTFTSFTHTLHVAPCTSSFAYGSCTSMPMNPTALCLHCSHLCAVSMLCSCPISKCHLFLCHVPCVPSTHALVSYVSSPLSFMSPANQLGVSHSWESHCLFVSCTLGTHKGTPLLPMVAAVSLI